MNCCISLAFGTLNATYNIEKYIKQSLNNKS